MVKAYDKVNTKVSPANPRTKAAKKKHGSFQSSSSRFAPPRDIVVEESDPAQPGKPSRDIFLAIKYPVVPRLKTSLVEKYKSFVFQLLVICTHS